MKKVLFILKKGCDYGFRRTHSGLYNSTRFVSDALGKDERIISSVVEVVDNNDIDREVYRFKPDLVVIEALWVVPEKFDVLKKLHPKVKWYVHLHSDIPFLANEGVAIRWVTAYLQNKVSIITNSKETLKAIEYVLPLISEHVRSLIEWGKVIYLPNCYPAQFGKRVYDKASFDVGCFGAIRPLKNQLIQAMAAIKYAKDTGKYLQFHINATRVEHGESVLKNLRALFSETGYQLVEHDWKNHHEFLSLVRRMDVCMQMSYSETFNIVSADAISSGVPVVASSEVFWLANKSQADPNKIDSIVSCLRTALNNKLLLTWNQVKLWVHSRGAAKKWIAFVLHA